VSDAVRRPGSDFMDMLRRVIKILSYYYYYLVKFMNFFTTFKTVCHKFCSNSDYTYRSKFLARLKCAWAWHSCIISINTQYAYAVTSRDHVTSPANDIWLTPTPGFPANKYTQHHQCYLYIFIHHKWQKNRKTKCIPYTQLNYRRVQQGRYCKISATICCDFSFDWYLHLSRLRNYGGRVHITLLLVQIFSKNGSIENK